MPDTVKRLLQDDYAIFLDLTQDFTFENNEWTRVKKSTQATYTPNEQTEEYNYIESHNSQVEIVGNNLQIALDQANIDGDPIYNFLEGQMVKLPTGEEAKVPFLYLMGGEDMLAVRGIASISDKELSPTDKTINYTLNAIETKDGTYEIVNKKPVFTPTTP